MSSFNQHFLETESTARPSAELSKLQSRYKGTRVLLRREWNKQDFDL
jgi:hypothetical protein